MFKIVCCVGLLFALFDTSKGQVTNCRVDFGIILDESGSVQSSGFQKSIEFLKKLIEAFNVGPNSAQVALVELTDRVSPNNMVNFNFQTHNSYSAVKQALNSIIYKGGRTPTGTAMEMLRTKVFGGPFDRPGVRNVAFVLTDGEPYDNGVLEPAKTAAQAPLLQNVAKVIAVGVGNVQQDTLEIIASMGDPDYIFKVDNFAKLNTVIGKLISKICKNDGSWSEWRQWSQCSRSCGTGVQSRARSCTNPPPMYGGQQCQGQSQETQFCNIRPCPIDGHWTAWSEWTTCDRSCGGGQRSRSRSCSNPPAQFGGKGCVGLPVEVETCNLQPCPINGGWSEWQQWTQCSASCGNGQQTRGRFCNSPPPQFGGSSCPGEQVQQRSCNQRPCPINGQWSNWSQWGTCSRSCGGGVQSRSRACNSPPPQFGGFDCRGAGSQSRVCNGQGCPQPEPTAKEFCFRCKGRRNQKDYYENPEDCTTYYHCFFFGNGEVEGQLQNCPEGQRFDEGILSCVPMINGLCTDPCNTTAIQTQGFWADEIDCGTYYQCSNYHSLKNCCPKGMRWDQTTKKCVDQPCESNCLPKQPITVPMIEPELIGENRCKDQYGVTYQIGSENTIFFVVMGDDTLVKFECGLGSFFELNTCKCSGKFATVIPHTGSPELILNITCDAKILDSSSYHFFVDNLGANQVSSTQTEVCQFRQPSNLEVPGFQTISLGNKVTIMFCVLVQCSEGNTVGLISNRGGSNNDELSVLFQVDSVGNMVAILETETSGSISVSSPLNCGRYVHVTLQYDGAVAVLYINGQQVSSKEGTGMIAWMKHCPLSIGHDQLAGYLNGFMDNILVYRRVLVDVETIQTQSSVCLAKNEIFVH